MFNKDPHMVTSYFGSLVKNMGTDKAKIFNPTHQFAIYYLAGLTFYRLDSLFNSGEIDKKYRKIKFYLTMLVPMIATKETPPPFNSAKKVEKYCNPIIEILNNETKCKKLFQDAVKIIQDSEATIEDKQSLKSRVMTDIILDAFDSEQLETI